MSPVDLIATKGSGPRLAAVLCAALAALPAGAQQAAGRGWFVGPTFEAALSHSEVRNSTVNNGTDFVTRLSPGLRVRGGFGKTRVALGYALNAIHRTRGDGGSEIQNTLDGSMSSELVDNLVFFNASAQVTSSALDAFGAQTAPGSLISNPNRAEVATVTMSPYLRGLLGQAATYELRVNASATNTRRSKAGDSSSYGTTLSVDSANSRAILGWGLLASRQRNEFRIGDATTSDRVNASMSIRPDTDLRFTLRGGRESNNVLTGERRSNDTAGGGITWTPSPRTSASFDAEHRYFGQSRRFSLQYRTPRSVWRMGGSRDVSGGANPNGSAAPFTLYQLLDALLLSSFPDPTERDAAVRVALEGRDPNTVVSGGFVNTSQSLQDRVDLGWTYAGLRLSASLQAFSSNTKTLRNGAFDGEPLRQHSYTSTLGWRLSPTASLNLTGNRLMTFGTSLQPGTDLKSLSFGYTDQISRLVTTNLSLRYSVFNSATNPYRETAATAAASLRF